MQEIVILGAGVAGISAAYHGQKFGTKCTIYEASERYGGLLDHFIINGFRFDKAVHLSFTKENYVRSLFDQIPYIVHRSNPFNFEIDKWLKHPVQNNLFPLPVQDKIDAIKSFIERPNAASTCDYKEWLIQQYGYYIAARFPMRYTKKYWTVPADQLSTDWIGNRLYRPSLDEVLHGAFTDETPNTYYAQEMRYPCKGGYRAFIEPLANECSIRTKKKAVYIDPILKYILFETGEKVYYEHLISTIPLPELIRTLKNVPPTILNLSELLLATSVALVSIGFNRPDISPNLWFYIYDEEILASRAYSPSLKSQDNVPAGCSSLQFEIYFSQYRPLPLQENLIDHIIDSMEVMQLASKNDIAVVDCRILPYANVVFEKGMVAKRRVIIEYLKTLDIHVAGRFGEWDYLWSDQSLLSGKYTVEMLVNT